MNWLFKIFANTADGALIVDTDQQIVYWNQAAEDMLGYTFDEVRGRFCHEVMCGRDDRGHAICQTHCRVSAALHTGKVVPNYDLVARTKVGEMRWLSISILEYSAEDDNRAIIHLFRDATQKKLGEQLIQNMFAKTKQDTGLTEREHEVLSVLVQGLGTSEIAQTLSISPNTVRNHVQNILHKLHVNSRVEAVAQAFELGLVNPGE